MEGAVCMVTLDLVPGPYADADFLLHLGVSSPGISWEH